MFVLSVSEVEVYGECSCNGYGRSCDVAQGDTVIYECRCTENTCGTHCEYCCEGYQNVEYVSRVVEPLFSCKSKLINVLINKILE